MNGTAKPRRVVYERPVWLVTFADLIALLIAFFVMMFATQKVDIGKWEALIDGLSQRLNPEQLVLISRPSAVRNVERPSPTRAIDLDYLDSVLRDKMNLDPALAGLDIRRHDDRIVIRLPEEVLFEPGSAVPIPAAAPVMFSLAGVLGTIGNRVDVVGHADPEPKRKGLFRTNWQLSIARAVAVSAALTRAGYHRPLAAAGYGATRFERLGDDIPADRRMAVARRVDVVIWPSKERL